jgi:outer membrane cobalamin receptor
MKRILLAIALTGFAFAAAAQGNPPAEEPEEAASTSLKAEAEADAKTDRYCIRETGSRIVASRNARSKQEQKDCVAAGGRVYTRADIDRTGSTDIADALRRLDPSIR